MNGNISENFDLFRGDISNKQKKEINIDVHFWEGLMQTKLLLSCYAPPIKKTFILPTYNSASIGGG